jgi:hypothetical protein
MDPLSTLAVRFYFGGQFCNNDQVIKYYGGRQAMSYIDRDHISLPEIVGHARDHCSVGEGTLLHWLFPGRDMMKGLRVLTTDQACLDMSNSICDSVVAEIYIEDIATQEAEQGKGVVPVVIESRPTIGNQIKAKNLQHVALKHNMKMNQKSRLNAMTQAQTMILFPVMIVLLRRMTKPKRY